VSVKVITLKPLLRVYLKGVEANRRSHPFICCTLSGGYKWTQEVKHTLGDKIPKFWFCL